MPRGDLERALIGRQGTAVLRLRMQKFGLCQPARQGVGKGLEVLLQNSHRLLEVPCLPVMAGGVGHGGVIGGLRLQGLDQCG